VEKHAEKETAESAGAPEMYLIGSMGQIIPIGTRQYLSPCFLNFHIEDLIW
jgi:hypothetical protein